MKKQWQSVLMLFVFIASLMMSAFPLASVVEAKGTVVKITLKGSTRFPSATGTAKYKVDGSDREFQVEVQNIISLAGRRLYVFVDGVKVGSFVVSSLGTGRLKRDTALGQAVPMIVSGSKVQVRTGAGALVVSGHF